MSTKDIDLVKIVDEVWKENELYSGTYKVAALTAMQKLQDLYETKRTEQQQSESNCNIPHVVPVLKGLAIDYIKEHGHKDELNDITSNIKQPRVVQILMDFVETFIPDLETLDNFQTKN